ncbi:MAG: arginine repressor [Acidobacteria bacterium]|nr:MAG: arginine repressor [Acidobacteriota bacterium]
MVPVRKNGRHGKILDLVARRPVSSQLELAALLRAQGVEVTQSTLSRDIHTLGLVKVRGLYRSAPSAAASAAAAPPDAMRRNLRQLVVRSGVSGNIVMVKTAPGNAHALGVVLDSAEWPEVMGTVAGDDTVFVLLRRASQGKKLLRRIEELLL